MRVLCVAALAALSTASLVQVHDVPQIGHGWTATETAADSTAVFRNVVIGMKRSNVAALKDLVASVSTPGSASYLQYPTYAELGDLVRPPQAATDTVKAWLQEHNVETIVEHPHGDHIRIEASVAQLEAMSGGRFTSYVHTSGKQIARMTGPVMLPAEIAAVVDTFSGFNGFPLAPVKRDLKVKKNVALGGSVQPPFLRTTYNVSSITPSGKPNIQAIAQFQGQSVRDEDLANFCKKYDPTSGDCKIAKYIGKDKQLLPGIESMLDTEYIVPLGKVPTWVYSYPSLDFCNDLIDFGGNVTGSAEYPFVISISYGSQKIGACSADLTSRFAADVEKMSAMGITVMISSGDDGSGHSTRQGINAGKLSPAYPSTVPHAVAVGSTWFQSGTSGAEEASKQFGSGGGFSYDFSAPSYQTAQIATYLSTVELPKEYAYATGGRGTPDVSTLGQDFTVLWHGLSEAVGGTSASSPTFAGLVSLLNEVCLTASGKTLGFINPLLYSNPQMFRDVTAGTNAIGKNKEGWAAIKGWDASTGLGTPDFPTMVEVVRKHCTNAL